MKRSLIDVPNWIGFDLLINEPAIVRPCWVNFTDKSIEFGDCNLVGYSRSVSCRLQPLFYNCSVTTDRL